MKNIIHIDYDAAPDYMDAAFEKMEALREKGYKNILVFDLGNGAEIEYED